MTSKFLPNNTNVLTVIDESYGVGNVFSGHVDELPCIAIVTYGLREQHLCSLASLFEKEVEASQDITTEGEVFFFENDGSGVARVKAWLKNEGFRSGPESPRRAIEADGPADIPIPMESKMLLSEGEERYFKSLVENIFLRSGHLGELYSYQAFQTLQDVPFIVARYRKKTRQALRENLDKYYSSGDIVKMYSLDGVGAATFPSAKVDTRLINITHVAKRVTRFFGQWITPKNGLLITMVNNRVPKKPLFADRRLATNTRIRLQNFLGEKTKNPMLIQVEFSWDLGMVGGLIRRFRCRSPLGAVLGTVDTDAVEDMSYIQSLGSMMSAILLAQSVRNDGTGAAVSNMQIPSMDNYLRVNNKQDALKGLVRSESMLYQPFTLDTPEEIITSMKDLSFIEKPPRVIMPTKSMARDYVEEVKVITEFLKIPKEVEAEEEDPSELTEEMVARLQAYITDMRKHTEEYEFLMTEEDGGTIIENAREIVEENDRRHRDDEYEGPMIDPQEVIDAQEIVDLADGEEPEDVGVLENTPPLPMEPDLFEHYLNALERNEKAALMRKVLDKMRTLEDFPSLEVYVEHTFDILSNTLSVPKVIQENPGMAEDMGLNQEALEATEDYYAHEDIGIVNRILGAGPANESLSKAQFRRFYQGVDTGKAAAVQIDDVEPNPWEAVSSWLLRKVRRFFQHRIPVPKNRGLILTRINAERPEPPIVLPAWFTKACTIEPFDIDMEGTTNPLSMEVVFTLRFHYSPNEKEEHIVGSDRVKKEWAEKAQPRPIQVVCHSPLLAMFGILYSSDDVRKFSKEMSTAYRTSSVGFLMPAMMTTGRDFDDAVEPLEKLEAGSPQGLRTFMSGFNLFTTMDEAASSVKPVDDLPTFLREHFSITLVRLTESSTELELGFSPTKAMMHEVQQELPQFPPEKLTGSFNVEFLFEDDIPKGLFAILSQKLIRSGTALFCSRVGDREIRAQIPCNFENGGAYSSSFESRLGFAVQMIQEITTKAPTHKLLDSSYETDQVVPPSTLNKNYTIVEAMPNNLAFTRKLVSVEAKEAPLLFSNRKGTVSMLCEDGNYLLATKNGKIDIYHGVLCGAKPLKGIHSYIPRLLEKGKVTV